KASEDLPEPERPVRTVSVSRGISTSTFFRLCSRAPRMEMFFSMTGSFQLRAAALPRQKGVGRRGNFRLLQRRYREESQKCQPQSLPPTDMDKTRRTGRSGRGTESYVGNITRTYNLSNSHSSPRLWQTGDPMSLQIPDRDGYSFSSYRRDIDG